MAGAVLTIAGVARDMQNGWSLRRSANARGGLLCDILSRGGVYRPTMNQVVQLTDNSLLVFGGYVSGLPERGVGGETWADIITELTAVDNNAIAERRYVSGTISAGSTLKAILIAIVGFLGSGLTVHGSQVDGPTITADLVLSDVRLDALLNDLTTMSGGWPWDIDENNTLRMQDPTVVTAPFNITVPNCLAIGDVEVEPSMEGYANTIIVKSANFRKTALDAGERAAYGIWEEIYTAPDDASETQMQRLAVYILARSLVKPKKVTYKTLTPGLKPRQTQTIVLPHRNVNNTFLIMEVYLRQAEDSIHYYYVTAVEGVVYQTDWREMYRRWGGSGSPVSGGILVGGGGTPSAIKRVYPIGGSETTAVRGTSGVFISATKDAVQAQIDTTEMTSLTATVKLQIRALTGGVSVQAQIYDKTASELRPGTSAIVTSTSWTPVTFSTTLNSGQHFYELRLSPGATDEDVQATGYVET